MGPTSHFMSYRKVTGALLAILVSVISCLAQSDAAVKASDEKAEQIIQKAIQAIGGDAYLNVKTVTGRGFYTQYHDGVSGVPLRFVDYIAYPDRERTEFTGDGNRIIQTNYQNEGWMFDAAAKTLKDQTAKQVEDFRTAMRTSMENLLRGWWRKEGATLSYVGRREASLGRRNEAVKLTYPDGFWIEYEFSAVEGTPAKAIYKRKQKNPDTDEMFETSEEDRFFKPVAVAGVSAPFVIDHFRNGVQTSRINYESIEFNKPLADSLFAKPANIKAIK
jgi:outer membrane lipoprotein-sorting protein